MKTGRKLRLLLAGGTLLAAVGAGSISTPGAHAATICRTDPLVTFTNGKYVRLWASTNTTASYVSLVTYNLQVPSTWKVQSITFDNVAPEKLNLTFNQQVNTYILTAKVSSSKTVTTSIWIQGNSTNSQSQDGTTNQWLTVDWSN